MFFILIHSLPEIIEYFDTHIYIFWYNIYFSRKIYIILKYSFRCHPVSMSDDVYVRRVYRGYIYQVLWYIFGMNLNKNYRKMIQISTNNLRISLSFIGMMAYYDLLTIFKEKKNGKTWKKINLYYCYNKCLSCHVLPFCVSLQIFWHWLTLSFLF